MALAITDDNIELVGLLKKNAVNCITLHCIIHQQALCGEMLQTSDVMKTVVQIVNLTTEINQQTKHWTIVSDLQPLALILI